MVRTLSVDVNQCDLGVEMPTDLFDDTASTATVADKGLIVSRPYIVDTAPRWVVIIPQTCTLSVTLLPAPCPLKAVLAYCSSIYS